MFAENHKAKSLKGHSQFLNGLIYFMNKNEEEGKWCFKDVMDNARKHMTYEDYAKKNAEAYLDMKKKDQADYLELVKINNLTF